MHDLPPGPLLRTSQAYAAGWTPSALRHAVRRRRLYRVRRGYYCSSAVDPLISARAAAEQYPLCAVSDRSAILLHGLPLVGRQPSVPELTGPPQSNGRLVGVHLYRATLRPDDLTFVDGIVTTSIARTLVDVARHRPMLTAVSAIDAALHDERVCINEIDDVLMACWNWPRILRAHAAMRLIDARAESPLESVSRVVIGWLGLPPPVPQQWIYDEHGRVMARCDFYWDEFGVVGEADGRGKYADNDVLDAEKDRQDDLGDRGLETARWGWKLATQNRLALRGRITRAFERGLDRKRAGQRRRWISGDPPKRPSRRQT